MTARAALGPTSPLVLQAQVGREPELELLASDPAAPGGVRVTRWRLALDRGPARREPIGRAVSRAILVPVALVVDLVTAPLQLLFVEMH